MPISTVARDHVSAAPYVIELGASLAYAAHCLSAWGVEIAPVVHEDEVCGLVSVHDLTFANELGASMHDVQLRDLRLHNVHLTSSEVSLTQIARAMVAQKASWAVVREGTQVVGLLSWAAVLAALANHAAESSSDPDDLAPRTVRNLILADHANIRHLMRRAEGAAARVITAQEVRLADLTAAYEAGRTLCTVMSEHFMLEERVLVPTLEALDAWGRVRADRMRAEHAEQALVLRSYAHALEQMMAAGHAGPTLGVMVQQLVANIRNDMRIEEETLLRPELFQDDPTAAVVEAG